MGPHIYYVQKSSKSNNLSERFFLNLSQVWKELKKDKNEYRSSLGSRRPKPIGALNSPRIKETVEIKKFQNFYLETSARSGKCKKKG
jgi:hypothetical protein